MRFEIEHWIQLYSVWAAFRGCGLVMLLIGVNQVMLMVTCSESHRDSEETSQDSM